ncbi:MULTISPECIES: ABC transporter ATP-binding protein [Phyllobacteriaceae]|uniref:Glycerol-3-phosphate ABC transporter ATP-binding protein n=4 Tax=Pseudomonadota TaxID=1224 RepID=A0A1C2E1D2_9HYPH|nr:MULTISPECIES: ABC transporter ATP-binding protein [Mesorhizobium]MBN9235634.1 ABC transporter ATP-binding protein [Mesorhizobium sp.]OCX20817.1 glycerol-3-phosphate ABC transporter ATP-binding protein [Mesorhizobium hungaricum]
MSGVLFTDISKSYGTSQVLCNLSLAVEDGEFLTLLGPSGCGKSTLLRILAGLEPQDKGSVSIGGRVVDGLRAKQRDIAMVFQSYALYPHMTVAENIGLPLKMRRLSSLQRLPLLGRFLPGTAQAKAAIEEEVQQAAGAVGIDHLLTRKPGQLSGGQRQRVAVGRAMVRHPAVFLMDEPLSNLDAKLRVQMRSEIKELHRRLGVTFIYVTHDQSEAMTLSDRVAVMLDGELLQVAPPQQIYANPTDRRVAEFVGSPKISMLDGVVRQRGHIEAGGVSFATNVALDIGAEVTLGIRPEAFHLCDRNEPGAIAGTIRLIEHMGSDLFVHLALNAGEPLVARLLAERAPHLAHGQLVNLSVRPDRFLVFDKGGERLLPAASVTPLREIA